MEPNALGSEMVEIATTNTLPQDVTTQKQEDIKENCEVTLRDEHESDENFSRQDFADKAETLHSGIVNSLEEILELKKELTSIRSEIQRLREKVPRPPIIPNDEIVIVADEGDEVSETANPEENVESAEVGSVTINETTNQIEARAKKEDISEVEPVVSQQLQVKEVANEIVDERSTETGEQVELKEIANEVASEKSLDTEQQIELKEEANENVREQGSDGREQDKVKEAANEMDVNRTEIDEEEFTKKEDADMPVEDLNEVEATMNDGGTNEVDSNKNKEELNKLEPTEEKKELNEMAPAENKNAEETQN